MNLYSVVGRRFAIIDDQLWMRIEPEAVPSPAAAMRQQRKPTIKKQRRGGKGKLSDADKDKIRRALKSGATKEDLAKQYGVSVSSIYNYGKTKPIGERTKDHAVVDYICRNGHEFKSKLMPGEAMCPTCHSTDCDVGTLNGAVKEDTL